MPFLSQHFFSHPLALGVVRMQQSLASQGGCTPGCEGHGLQNLAARVHILALPLTGSAVLVHAPSLPQLLHLESGINNTIYHTGDCEDGIP